MATTAVAVTANKESVRYVHDQLLNLVASLVNILAYFKH